jgi:hypothetical protein
MDLTLLGMVTLANLEHREKAFSPISVTLSGRAMLVRLAQPENAPTPMHLTPSGMVTLVRLVQYLKAEDPMLATGRPLTAMGIVTAPTAPLYLVIVIVPLLVV